MNKLLQAMKVLRVSLTNALGLTVTEIAPVSDSSYVQGTFNLNVPEINIVNSSSSVTGSFLNTVTELCAAVDQSSSAYQAADTRPRFSDGFAKASSSRADELTLLAGMTIIPGSTNGGKSGTFNLITTSSTYGWVAVLASASATGVRFFDGLGYGGWSGAGLVGNNAGASNDPSTSTITFSDNSGITWRLFRQDYVNTNPSPGAAVTIS